MKRVKGLQRAVQDAAMIPTRGNHNVLEIQAQIINVSTLSSCQAESLQPPYNVCDAGFCALMLNNKW